MANVFDDLAGDIYKSAEIVGRKLVGVIPSVTINAGAEEAAQGDPVKSFVTQAPTVNNSATPSMTIPEGDDQTATTKTMTVSQIASVRIPWTGEDMKKVNNSFGYDTVYGKQIERAFEAIVQQIEGYTAGIAYKGASRAWGTAGTTPFASNFNEVANLRKILADNGMFNDGMVSLVLDTTAGTNLRNLAQLQKANEAGGDDLLRRGTLLDLQGIMLKESAGIQLHTKGTATLLDAAGGEPIGETSIALDGGDGGSLLSGDIVTFAGDTNKYVVNTGFTAASGTAVIGAPGLRATLADTVEMTIGNSYRANLCVHQAAVELVMRPLAKPNGGDAAVDEMIVQDAFSGLTFRLSAYKGYNKAMFDITVLYDAKVWNSDGVAILLG